MGGGGRQRDACGEQLEGVAPRQAVVSLGAMERLLRPRGVVDLLVEEPVAPAAGLCAEPSVDLAVARASVLAVR